MTDTYPSDPNKCQRCHAFYNLRDGEEPTPECDPCAHECLAEERTARMKAEREADYARHDPCILEGQRHKVCSRGTVACEQIHAGDVATVDELLWMEKYKRAAAERDAALRTAAAVREAIVGAFDFIEWVSQDCTGKCPACRVDRVPHHRVEHIPECGLAARLAALKAALSSDAGKGWMSPEEAAGVHAEHCATIEKMDANYRVVVALGDDLAHEARDAARGCRLDGMITTATLLEDAIAAWEGRAK